MLTFEDKALIWLKSTIPIGLSAGWLAGGLATGEFEINDNSAHQLGLSWCLGGACQNYQLDRSE